MYFLQNNKFFFSPRGGKLPGGGFERRLHGVLNELQVHEREFDARGALRGKTNKLLKVESIEEELYELHQRIQTPDGKKSFGIPLDLQEFSDSKGS